MSSYPPNNAVNVANGGVPVYNTFTDLPAKAGNGSLAVTGDTNVLYEYILGTTSWDAIAAPSSALSIGTFNSGVASVNGAHIDSDSLIMQAATATVPGLVSTGTQTFAGAKTFTGAISASNLSGTNTGDQTLNSLLPTQTGHSGEFLTTDGTNSSWASGGGGGSQWTTDGDNIFFDGGVSVGSLTGNTITGNTSMAVGDANNVSGQGSLALGQENIVPGTSSFAFGATCTASGDNSFSGNEESVASGNRSTSLGGGTIAQCFQQLAVGSYNIPQGNATNTITTDEAFIVGNGVDDDNRSNAFAVTKDARLKYFRQLIPSQDTPPTVVAEENAGTDASAILSTGSTDVAGEIQLTSGSALIDGGAIVTVTYDQAYPNGSFVTLQASNLDTGDASVSSGGFYVTTTASGFTINVIGLLNTEFLYKWQYTVIGR